MNFAVMGIISHRSVGGWGLGDRKASVVVQLPSSSDPRYIVSRFILYLVNYLQLVFHIWCTYSVLVALSAESNRIVLRCTSAEIFVHKP